MNPTPGRLGRAAERLINVDGGPGDERERAIVAQSTSLGFVVGIYASLVVALAAAVLGGLVLPVALLLVMAVPAWTAIWFAGRRGVDMNDLVDQEKARTRAATFGVVFGGLILVTGAMAYTVFTGHGLIHLPPGELIGPDATGWGASFVKGSVIGAVGGAVIGFVAILVGSRIRTRRADRPVPDEG